MPGNYFTLSYKNTSCGVNFSMGTGDIEIPYCVCYPSFKCKRGGGTRSLSKEDNCICLCLLSLPFNIGNLGVDGIQWLSSLV